MDVVIHVLVVVKETVKVDVKVVLDVLGAAKIPVKVAAQDVQVVQEHVIQHEQTLVKADVMVVIRHVQAVVKAVPQARVMDVQVVRDLVQDALLVQELAILDVEQDVHQDVKAVV